MVYNCHCRNINQNWVFGKGARLDFATSIPTPLSSSIGTRDGCASISDTNGNLIMYTDGLRVWDSTDNVRITGLHGSLLSTQSAVIVPHPGNTAQYYIFTTSGVSSGNHHLACTLIDTNTWSDSPVPMPIATGYSPTEKLTAIQHVNRRDFWVISIVQPIVENSTESGLGVLRIFLITPNSIQQYPDVPLNMSIHDRGYLKGSRDGKRIAMANWTNENILVIPFDNSDASVNISGIITIPVPLASLAPAYGVEFSPDSNILYFTVAVAEGNGYVFQCDLLSDGSWSQVGQPYPSVAFALGALQLGIDDRIYIAQHGKPHLGIIANPNILGEGCTLTFDAISLDGRICLMGLPNLIPNLCEPIT